MENAIHVSKTVWLPGLLVLMAVAPSPGVQAARSRGPEVCPGGRGLGDKWFDGCQWCVCTIRGALCSRSECSSLVRQVAPCHEVGLRWTDGCYRCRCKRNGIACRLDVTCLLLRHRPVPCLADERCVCGLDGVPSCTAEVIDRQAYAAKRVHLILPPFLDPETAAEGYDHSLRVRGASGSHHRRRGLRASRGGPSYQRQQGRRRGVRGEQVSQELLITSDNLCRFGPRWYGGSLRCFCDVDGAITCGNPAFVTAFYDDFVVERKECEEGHLWEDGCSICSCRRNGVVFCRHDRQCRHRFDDDDDAHDDHDDATADDDENNNEIDLGDTDHYLPHFNEAADDDLDDLDLPDVADLDEYPFRQRHHGTEEGEEEGERENGGRRTGNEQPERNDHVGKGRKRTGEESEDRKDGGSGSLSSRHDNDAHERPASLKPFYPRAPRGGPFMSVPTPATVFRGPPAYSRPSAYRHSPCGRFKVGAKFWKACNLCLCTTKGPRCQGKLCW